MYLESGYYGVFISPYSSLWRAEQHYQRVLVL